MGLIEFYYVLTFDQSWHMYGFVEIFWQFSICMCRISSHFLCQKVSENPLWVVLNRNGIWNVRSLRPEFNIWKMCRRVLLRSTLCRHERATNKNVYDSYRWNKYATRFLSELAYEYIYTYILWGRMICIDITRALWQIALAFCDDRNFYCVGW